MNKKISVIMSVYNDEKNVDDAIQSIINQTYQDFELLIMDDCSEDMTGKICKEYEKNFENIKIYKNSKNLGLTKSLNILISKSSGEYIARQDSDDISLRSRFENQIDYIESEKLDGCSTLSLIKGKGTIFPKFSSYFNPKFIAKIKNPFVHGSLIIKKEVFNAVNNYDENFYYTQDYKLTSDMLNNGYKIRVLNELLYISNTENNISSLHYFEQRNYAKQVRRENLKFWRTV
tara:strand:+ start:439 stop:1134 length:696 start_codon:yes stop_codon:yes gene_type:complete